MDRRRSRISVELLAHALHIDGKITHVEMKHESGTVEICFEGDGSFQVAEGMESVIRSPDEWRRAELEEELKHGNRTGCRNIVPN